MPSGSKNQAFLFVDNWDDWGKYRTQFSLHVADEIGEAHHIGSVKIGQKGLQPSGRVSKGHRAPALDETFNALHESYFSLGQSESYYESPMARSNSPTLGHPKFPQAGRSDYDDSGVMAMRAAASLRR